MPHIDYVRLILKGVTSDGVKFRPSDWAERLCGNLCTFRNRRMYYSPLLRPSVIDGVKCVVVNSKLNDEHPAILEEVVQFAEKNHLIVEKEQ